LFGGLAAPLEERVESLASLDGECRPTPVLEGVLVAGPTAARIAGAHVAALERNIEALERHLPTAGDVTEPTIA
jgi:hypothetical protein